MVYKIAVSGRKGGVGKTTVACGVASVFASQGQKVLVVGEKALQVELAENEKRVNYSRDPIEKLAAHLRELNYKETRGRPKQGEKALGPALAVAIGVSTRLFAGCLGKKKRSLPKK